jgi:hypothetical protein
VENWTVPPYRSTGSTGGLTTMADISEGSIFIAVDPCRVVDTRGPAGPYGGPALVPGPPRTFDIDGGPCTFIPPNAAAYSLSIGGIVPPNDGFLTAWPTGDFEPLVSQLNMIGGEVVANAAIVPAGNDGSIDVLVNVGPVHVYIDINGYFMGRLPQRRHPCELQGLHTNLLHGRAERQLDGRGRLRQRDPRNHGLQSELHRGDPR